MVFCGFVKIFREPWMCDGFSSMTRHKFIPSLCIPVLPARTEQEKGLCRDFEWWREGGWVTRQKGGVSLSRIQTKYFGVRAEICGKNGFSQNGLLASKLLFLIILLAAASSIVSVKKLTVKKWSIAWIHNQEMLFSLNCWWFWSCGVLNLMMNRPIKDVQWKC